MQKTISMEDLFRKKSLDKLNSPENLDEYLKVSNISGWLIILALVLIIVGAIFWISSISNDGINLLDYLFKN